PALVGETFGTLAEAVLIADARGRIIFVNPTACRLLRSDSLDTVGRPLAEVFRLVNRQSHKPGEDPVDRALRSDRPLPLISEDGLAGGYGEPPTPIVWTARAVFDPQGGPQ